MAGLHPSQEEVEALRQRCADPIQKAVDDWIDMERKAAAWDELVWLIELGGYRPDCREDLDAVMRSVHPAQTHST